MGGSRRAAARGSHGLPERGSRSRSCAAGGVFGARPTRALQLLAGRGEPAGQPGGAGRKAPPRQVGFRYPPSAGPPGSVLGAPVPAGQTRRRRRRARAAAGLGAAWLRCGPAPRAGRLLPESCGTLKGAPSRGDESPPPTPRRCLLRRWRAPGTSWVPSGLGKTPAESGRAQPEGRSPNGRLRAGDPRQACAPGPAGCAGALLRRAGKGTWRRKAPLLVPGNGGRWEAARRRRRSVWGRPSGGETEARARRRLPKVSGRR